MFRLPIRYLLLEELLTLLLAGGFAAIIQWAFLPYTIVWYTLWFLLGGVTLYVMVFYLPMYRENYRVTVNHGVICRESGVWFRKTDHLRLEQVSVIRSLYPPLWHWFNLSILVIGTAGYRLFLIGLDAQDAALLAAKIEKS